ncbi:hypothetical protein RRG08_046013 [Elysia crispata]|uniref:Uncharacterized protein n=1 Tax=Elysia crispata TaxID=231223 RepID=A0AAE0ZD50_9GAST|nr:hypothetical protein RRG08_046013 [Elysia crispata]
MGGTLKSMPAVSDCSREAEHCSKYYVVTLTRPKVWFISRYCKYTEEQALRFTLMIQHRKPFEPRPEVACEAAALATSSDWRVVLGDWPRDMLGLATSSDWRVVLGDWPRDMVSLQTSGLVGLVLTSKTHRPGSIRLHAIESRPGSLDNRALAVPSSWSVVTAAKPGFEPSRGKRYRRSVRRVSPSLACMGWAHFALAIIQQKCGLACGVTWKSCN